SRAELSCLDRHPGNDPGGLVAILVEAPLNLLLRLLARISVSLLKQADQLVLLTADPVDIVIGEVTPPRFKLAAHLLPLSCQDVLVHGIGLDIVFHFSYLLLWIDLRPLREAHLRQRRAGTASAYIRNDL